MSGLGGPKSYEIRSALGSDRNICHEVVLTGTQACEKLGKHWVDKPNAGYSGTPMWKLALERKEQEAGAPSIKIPEGFKPTEKGGEWYYSEKRQVYWRSTDGQMYVYDSMSQKHCLLYEAKSYELRAVVGACFHERASQVRHLLVRDLHKAGTALRMSLEHLDRPCALYALYEGHRASPSAAASGNQCAEFCAKQLHLKLLPKLSSYRGYWEDSRLEAAMRESFEEVDADFAERNKASPPPDGCCAAVALVAGRRLVVASSGDVACVVVKRGGEASELLKPHAVPDSDDEEDSDDEAPAAPAAPTAAAPRAAASSAVAVPGAAATNASPSAPSQGPRAQPPIKWTRAFGDIEFKDKESAYSLPVTPDVRVLHLDLQHQGFAFVCRALYNAIGRSVAVSTVFRRSAGRARMASGALLDAAVQWLGQVGESLGLGSVVVFFDRLEEAEGEPLQKKARKEVPTQVRLRHILLKHRECKSTVDKVRSKTVKRTRNEAERLLRAVLEECGADADKRIFSQRCKELSECQSCLKSGELVGDLGWVKPGKFGSTFDEAAFALQVGQLSDLVDSDQGVHIVLRAA